MIKSSLLLFLKKLLLRSKSSFLITSYHFDFSRHVLLFSQNIISSWVHITSYIYSVFHRVISFPFLTSYPFDFSRHILLFSQNSVSSWFHTTSYTLGLHNVISFWLLTSCPLVFTKLHILLSSHNVIYSCFAQRHILLTSHVMSSCFHTIYTFLYTHFVLYLPYKSLYA